MNLLSTFLEYTVSYIYGKFLDKVSLFLGRIAVLFEEEEINKKKMDLMVMKGIMTDKEEQEFIQFRHFMMSHGYQTSDMLVTSDILVKLIQKNSISPDSNIYLQAWKMNKRRGFSFVCQSWIVNATENDLCQLAICVYNHWNQNISWMLCPGCRINPSIIEKFDCRKLLEAEAMYSSQKVKMEVTERDYLSKIRKVIEKLKIFI